MEVNIWLHAIIQSRHASTKASLLVFLLVIWSQAHYYEQLSVLRKAMYLDIIPKSQFVSPAYTLGLSHIKNYTRRILFAFPSIYLRVSCNKMCDGFQVIRIQTKEEMGQWRNSLLSIWQGKFLLKTLWKTSYLCKYSNTSTASRVFPLFNLKVTFSRNNFINSPRFIKD